MLTLRWHVCATDLSKRLAIYIVRDFLLSERHTINAPLQDIHVLLEAEKEIQRDHHRFIELFTVPRNRRATLASLIVMFM